jgi:hypothetical protein
LIILCSIAKDTKAKAFIKTITILVRKIKTAKVAKISGWTEIRWGSLFDMLESFLQKKSVISEFVKLKNPDFDWCYLEWMLKLLLLAKRKQDLLYSCGTYGMVAPELKNLQNELENFTEDMIDSVKSVYLKLGVNSLRSEMLDQTNKRFEKYQIKASSFKATIFDPLSA